MGNCLVLQENAIKVVKTDGKILDFRPPIKVDEVLSEFSGHALSESFSGSHHLLPDAQLITGRFYYLTPLPLPSPKTSNKKKKVRFSDQEVLMGATHEQGTTAGVLRVKLLITKRELQEMLLNGGFSVQDVVSKIQSEKSADIIDAIDANNCREWKAVLESIPEVD